MYINNLTDVANIAECVTCIAAVIGVIVANKTFKADHERRKAQATIEFYRSIGDKCDVSLNQIGKNFPKDTVIMYDVVKADYGTYDKIVHYLNLMEEMSVGINKDIFDIDVFRKIAGVHSKRWFKKLKNVIDGIRKNDGHSGCYSDFEKMVNRLKRERISKHT